MSMMNSCGGPTIPRRTKVGGPLCKIPPRLTCSLVPFLPVRDDFHPKRNQARQKLATLPTSRFKDLSSDVYFELARRYPDFKEEVCSPCCHYVPPDSPRIGSRSITRIHIRRLPRPRIPQPVPPTTSPAPRQRPNSTAKPEHDITHPFTTPAE